MTRARLLFAGATASAALCAPCAARAQYAPLEQPIAAPYAPPAQPIAAPYAPPAQPVPAPYGVPGAPGVVAYGGPMYYAAPPAPAPQPPRTITRMHGTIGLSLSTVMFTDAGFGRTASLWGYSGFSSPMQVALDGGVHLAPWVLVGARLGYGTASAGYSNFDGSALSMQNFDAGAIVRLGAPVALRHDWVFFPGAQLEGGAVSIGTSLRGEGASALVPRVAALGMAMFASRWLGLSVRLGYQYARRAGASGPETDVSIAGVTLGLAVEVRL